MELIPETVFNYELFILQRLEMRAQKFGVELSGDAKKEARAARFGISAPTNTAVSIKSYLNGMYGRITNIKLI
jgi:hypothetical protein